MRYTIIIGFGLAAVVLMGIAAPHVRGYVYGEPRYQPHEVEAAKESIALSLMGQLQLSVGDLMWLKSMEYLHVGVVQRMPTRAEEERGYRRRDAQNVAAGLGHTEGVNMVLDAERDWRGLFGEIERNVKPYTTAHVHDDPVELIPWYQLAVKLNPSLERLYTLGAFYLADFANEPGEAREMLEAGIEANPYSFEIHGALGRLYVDFAERLDELEHHHHDEHHDEDGHEDHHDEDHHDEDHHDEHHHDEDHHDEHHHDEDHHDEDHHDEDHHDEDHHDEHHHDEHHHDEHHIETPQQAYEEAVELLTRAVELADKQRKQMAANREIFDDFQNQVFGESYLFLSQAHAGLGQYEEAIAAADTGYETVSQYKQRNLLRVQARTVRKALEGEVLDERELAQLQAAGDTTRLTNTLPELESTSGREEATEKPQLPVSVLTGVAPPVEPVSIPDEALALLVLEDARAHPMETVAQRAARLERPADALQDTIEALKAQRFLAEHPWGGQTVHTLLPPGLYVALGHYGLDFWSAMAREAEALNAQGVEVDLMADSQTR